MALAASPALAQQPAAPPAAPQIPAPRATPPQANSPQPTATPPAAAQPAAAQPAAAQPTPLPEERPPEADLEAFKAELDDISKAFEDAHTEDELLALRQRLAPLRDEIRQRVGVLEPRLKQITDRLAELGVAPAAGAAPEDATIAAERSRLVGAQTEFDGAVKQARLLAGRGDELAEAINTRRRQIFTDRLFARSANLFDPGFWAGAAAAVPGEFRTLRSILGSWMAVARATYDPTSVLAAAATLIAIGLVAGLAIYWARRFTARPAPRRFDKALRALVVLAAHALAAAGLIAAFVLVLRDHRLIPQPAADLLVGLAAGWAVAGFGRGVAVALFAPRESFRRIIPWADQAAVSYAAHLSWGAAALGLTILLSALHRASGAPLAPVVATWALFAAAFVIIAVHLLWRSAQADFRAESAVESGARLPWLRILLWPITIAVAVALAAGYVGLAAFLAVRLLAVLAVGGALTVALVFVDAFATEVVASDTARGRRLAAVLGVTPNALDLITALVSALVRLVLIVVAVLLLVGYSGLFADDIANVFQISRWDFSVGGIDVAPSNIFAALAILLIGFVAVRAAQRWLESQFLPRTRLDAGLQNSIAALTGYSALVAVLALALGALGIDLQKIALIAGALSVGIGFGLQSVVSNFVCGLILLAERPIRVGDWVVVRNEEGWVRRISVRATEIETFDRATVIIPNQDFITGVVKNWTHGNTMGRVVVKVRVAFDSDAEKVLEVLRACGEDHPQVLRAPAPTVYLMGIGDIGLDFELRCLIANVEQSIAVATELRLEILRRF
ncbi:MAG: mechanosensitive ion channel family protein, partial [Xanthobacteraceae bacterium]|nr:mechanosensitive ion channel family protein [Xanthobacteraceae bacterium]